MGLSVCICRVFCRFSALVCRVGGRLKDFQAAFALAKRGKYCKNK
ncbi:hypothetical protein HMPREF9120_02289 [Neisseria sp. oral taxon 020 str. F0370]|nr:hypothetical protein HMPREF9120_02289 [Neisseria sp. oral taxon 020 str. F0370]